MWITDNSNYKMLQNIRITFHKEPPDRERQGQEDLHINIWKERC